MILMRLQGIWVFSCFWQMFEKKISTKFVKLHRPNFFKTVEVAKFDVILERKIWIIYIGLYI